MFTPTQLLEKVNAALAALPLPAAPEGLYAPIVYDLSSGGKRLRPVLLLMTYNLYRHDVEPALPAAVGLEIYHNHTLLHDDLMDNADVRRGRPTVHRRWGANTAILSGDAMLILAFSQIAACHCPQHGRVLELFARTAREVCEGQQLDMDFEHRTDVTEAEYVEMIRLKTSVLLACAARMGALVATAPEADADALYAFAERVGLAFQLQDDYLDVYGDPAVFGKATGGDILCGKNTFLLVGARARAGREQRRRLDALLADSTLPAAEKIAGVTAVYDELGMADACREAIDAYYAEARRWLERIAAPAGETEALWAYAASLLDRTV